MAGEELAVLRMNGYVKVRTLHVQTEHEILGLDDRLEHAKILSGRLALDRCHVEAAEGMDDVSYPYPEENELLIWTEIFWYAR